MEKRKETLSSLKLCRFCLTQSDSLRSIYGNNRTAKDSVNLPLKILTCVSIEVFPSDKMPCYICDRCRYFMNLFYEYKNIVRQSDENILDFLQNGSHIESISWPNTLSKAFKSSSDFGVQTIVEGSTVHVTSHDISDSDEEDANVYNVKIGDGPDAENKTTCIKVVTSKDTTKNDTSGNKANKNIAAINMCDTEDGDLDTTLDKNQSDLGDGCWPCDECDRTYPLQQLLELHKMQKHRARNVECDQCEAKFYSKYDLAAHQLRHSSATPFQCVACGKSFKRLILLKRHEKHIHSDLPQQVCPYCPASFLSIEELAEHQKRHTQVKHRPHCCPICNKKFHDKATLQRHKEAIHEKILNYHCEYCPERFGSVTKLARHVRSHAGERPYPCKFCQKSFTKSHHYTRHLRLKHRAAELSETEHYRCEQCDATFHAQDDLIYHSAIHATQNLTCPLCQERFQDVDAVTTHIKSHVNGVEFMCDFCELVFTSKEKLDNHIMLAHEDEVQNEMEQDESSMEMEGEEEDDDNGINLKEVDENNMVIEIKKPDNFIIKNVEEESQDRNENTNSEESEVEATYTELATVDTLAAIEKGDLIKTELETLTSPSVDILPPAKDTPAESIPTATIVRRAEDAKRKIVIRQGSDSIIKKEKPTKVESSSGGASDKSLRLLEKELQDLKRTNSRNENTKTPLKTVETLKSRRAQIHTSTPKQRMVEEKKLPVKNSAEKKIAEKRPLTKENKEPKEVKSNNGSAKEDKEKDGKDNDVKDKDSTPKSVIKNGSSDKTSEDGIRRSTRPSKIKDYAKLIRDKPQGDSDMDESDDDDEEYKEVENKSLESRLRARRSIIKQTPKPPPAAPSPAPRKRGRPRKDQPKDVPAKVRKESIEEPEEAVSKEDTNDKIEKAEPVTEEAPKTNNEKITKEPAVVNSPEKISSTSGGVLVSPTGQTLKKVPIKALPPGVKPLPLPANARHMPTGDLCEMQIGKKVVKVQKIVMTRAEVEEMAKKGLLEMKDGTMVLKQVIKMPAGEAALRATLAGDGDAARESQRKEKAVPSRCDLEEES